MLSYTTYYLANVSIIMPLLLCQVAAINVVIGAGDK